MGRRARRAVVRVPEADLPRRGALREDAVARVPGPLGAVAQPDRVTLVEGRPADVAPPPAELHGHRPPEAPARVARGVLSRETYAPAARPHELLQAAGRLVRVTLAHAIVGGAGVHVL